MPEEHPVVVTKNRFGPAAPGPHLLAMGPGGVRLLPHPNAYLSLAPPDRGQAPAQDPLRWGVDQLDRTPNWPPFGDCVTAVHGADAGPVSWMASRLGGQTCGEEAAATLLVNLSRAGREPDYPFLGPGSTVVPAGDAYLSGHALLAAVCEALERAGTVRRVLIGDLRSLRTSRLGDSFRRAITVVVRLLKDRRIPVVVFETGKPRTWAVTMGQGQTTFSSFAEIEPPVVDFADVTIELVSTDARHGFWVFASDLRRGVGMKWNEPWPHA
ncbi:MAG: hypothetical protein HY744_34605 [Deltaproteobacteria bacterium]|nr:hypothetical protein [Deltaproteobacteria bacterium]